MQFLFNFYRYRNTLKHTLYLEMLREGYHKSFAELFALIKQQNELRLAAGPESALWNMVLLEDEREKMETLQLYLTQAEAALRKGTYGDVCVSPFLFSLGLICGFFLLLFSVLLLNGNKHLLLECKTDLFYLQVKKMLRDVCAYFLHFVQKTTRTCTSANSSSHATFKQRKTSGCRTISSTVACARAPG